MKKTILFSALLSLFIFSACTESTSSSETVSSYPSLYIDANLPQYPNAIITDSSQGRNLLDGISIDFETNDSIPDIKNFFEIEMANRGFEIPELKNYHNLPPELVETVYMNQYSLENKSYSIQATKASNEEPSLVHISYNE